MNLFTLLTTLSTRGVAILLFLFAGQVAWAQGASSSFCPDLTVKDIEIIGQKGKKIELQFTIVNGGNTRLDLGGHTDDSNDDVYWAAYLSGDDKYQKGDVFVGTKIVGSGFIPEKSELKQKITLKLNKRTSFTNFLVLYIDSEENALECKETNNTISLRLP